MLPVHFIPSDMVEEMRQKYFPQPYNSFIFNIMAIQAIMEELVQRPKYRPTWQLFTFSFLCLRMKGEDKNVLLLVQ